MLYASLTPGKPSVARRGAPRWYKAMLALEAVYPYPAYFTKWEALKVISKRCHCTPLQALNAYSTIQQRGIVQRVVVTEAMQPEIA